MYCEVNGQEIKFDSLLAEATRFVKSVEDGCIELSFDQVNKVVCNMWAKVYSGKFVASAGYAKHSSPDTINMQHLAYMQSDLLKLQLLLEWVETHEQGDSLFFA